MSAARLHADATGTPAPGAAPTARFDAVVLAGGRGSRLGGRDKATIDVGGRTLLEGVLDAVGHARQIVVVGPPHAGLENVVTACEDPPGGGPVAALAAAMSSVSTDTVVLLATDLPFVTRVVVDHLRATLASVRGVGAAVAVDDTGHLQWLLAAWRADALRHALGCVGPPDGRSLRDLGGHVEVAATTMPDGSRRELPVWFDIDTVEELAGQASDVGPLVHRFRAPPDGRLPIDCAAGSVPPVRLSASPVDRPKGESVTSAREQQVRRFVDEVWNQRNYDAVADLYSERFTAPYGSGPGAKADMIQRYHRSFPDLHMDIDELIVADDEAVVVRLNLRGTDLGGYAGRPPTGRSAREWVVNILHFEDDRVVREFIGADKLGLFIDLGVVADPWPA